MPLNFDPADAADIHEAAALRRQGQDQRDRERLDREFDRAKESKETRCKQ